jgi:anti-anti-sigma regulatory factor
MQDAQRSPFSPADEQASERRPPRRGVVRVLAYPTEAVVWLVGDVDLGVGDELAAAVRRLAEVGLPVRVDASQVVFSDSAAVHFLAGLLHAGLRVRVYDPTGRLADVLELAGAPADLVVAVRTTAICPPPSALGALPLDGGLAADPRVPAALTAQLIQRRRARRRTEWLRLARHRA